MDVATLIGMVIAFVFIFIGMTIEGTQVTALLLPPPWLIVLPGTFGASLASGYMKDIGGVMKATKEAT